MEGYQLYMVRWQDKAAELQPVSPTSTKKNGSTSLLQLDFVKSLLTVNPYMVSNKSKINFHLLYIKHAEIFNFYVLQSQHAHLYLQGDDKIYINLCENLKTGHAMKKYDTMFFDMNSMPTGMTSIGVMPSESKQWMIITIPSQYSATNWPIRV